MYYCNYIILKKKINDLEGTYYVYNVYIMVVNQRKL